MQEKIAKIAAELPKLQVASPKWNALVAEMQQLQGEQKDYLTWKDIAKIFENDKYCRVFAPLFVNRGVEIGRASCRERV